MRRKHDMLFGSTIGLNDSIRFGLWAPAAQQVEIRPIYNACILDLRPGESWKYNYETF